MSYLVWINNLVVVENNEEYDFLDEMYPEIKDQFNIIWKIKNSSPKPFSLSTRNKINRIKDDINIKLNILGIDEHILFIKKDDGFIEPISGEEFNISKKSLNLRAVSEEQVSKYTSELTNENIMFLKTKLSEFKENINSYQKRK